MTLALDPVHRRDQAWVLLPGIDVGAAVTAEATQELGVGDLELEAELLAHLVPPLDLQCGRADDQDLLDAVAREQLLGHEAGLDGLAEAHVVGDQ